MTNGRTYSIVWAIEVDYGYGWEWDTTEDTYSDAVAQIRCYRENVSYPVRMRRRRLYSDTSSTTREV